MTKSLALPTRPIPAMFDFISTAAEYIYDDVILTTLAELENSEPYPYSWESSTARSLARQLVGPNRIANDTIRAQFARALRERPGESIEDLLDRTGGTNANLSSQSADERFRFAIRRLFTVIGWDVEWSPLVLFLMRQFARTGCAHTFVSFNYDLVLERGIEIAINGNLDLTKLYGFPISMQITADPPPSKNEGGGAFSGVPVTSVLSQDMQFEVSVLKPHGSLNWLAPIKGHYEENAADDLRQGKSVILPLDDNGKLRYFPTTNLPPWVQLPNDLPIQVEPVIVTPRGAKKADCLFLRNIRDQEEAAILNADEVYVLGWSLPRTDVDQECMIRTIVGKRPKPFQKLITVNLAASADHYARVQAIFGVERMASYAYNAGFRNFSAGCT